MFQSIYSKIIKNIQKSLGKDSGWIIDSVIDHTISISKYDPLPGEKKKNSIGISVFGYENKENIQSMYQSNFL